MTPEERQELRELKDMVMRLRAVEDVPFIEQLKRRLDEAIDRKIAAVELNDLADVNTSGVSANQVIKYNNSNQTWEPANDIDT